MKPTRATGISVHPYRALRHLSLRSVLIILLTAMSCTNILQPERKRNQGVTISLKPDTPSLGVKSSYLSRLEDESAIRSATIFITGEDGCFYSEYITSDAFRLDLKPGMEYTADVFVNMGDLRGRIGSHGEVAEYRHGITGSGLTNGGLPMYGSSSFTVSSGSDRISLKVDRLVARYELLFSTAGITSGSLRVKSVQMRNVPRYVSGSSFKAISADDITPEGDYASVTDITKINNGEGAYFYMPENRQGRENSILIPSDKIPSYSFQHVNPELCSYLEVTCGYTIAGLGQTEDVIYRIYLGENSTCDFNVTRNTWYRITLQPTDIDPDRSWWKCEPQFGYDYRLHISPDDAEISIGESLTLRATLEKNLHGSLMESRDVSSSVQWEVISGRNLVRNDGLGRFTGTGEGTASIRANYGSISSDAARISVNSGQKRVTVNIHARAASFGMKYWVRATNGISNAACYATDGTASSTNTITVRKRDNADVFTVTPDTLKGPSTVDYHTYDIEIDGRRTIGSGSFSIDWSNMADETHNITVTPVYPETRTFTLRCRPEVPSNGLSASISYKNTPYDDEAEVEYGRQTYFLEAVANSGETVSKSETVQVFGNTIRVQGFRFYGSTAKNIEVICNGVRVFSGEPDDVDGPYSFRTPEFQVNSTNVVIEVILR